jgi:hypothetical protein
MALNTQSPFGPSRQGREKVPLAIRRVEENSKTIEQQEVNHQRVPSRDKRNKPILSGYQPVEFLSITAPANHYRCHHVEDGSRS